MRRCPLRVEQKMQSMLGRVSVEPGRQIYPLSALLPTRFAKGRIALVGEAAHVFPPIGAQGLNLGIRDVEDIVRTAASIATIPAVRRRLPLYDRRRRPDILARSTAVNLLNVSLLSDMLPAQLARSAGLGVLGALAPLRAFFMREGMQPGSGFARAVSSLREQVRRVVPQSPHGTLRAIARYFDALHSIGFCGSCIRSVSVAASPLVHHS